MGIKMKRNKFLFACILFILLFPGCSLSRKPTEIPVSVPSTVTIVTPTVKTVVEDVPANNDEIIESEVTKTNTIRCELGKITYEIPDTWTSVIKNGSTFYYPFTGVFQTTFEEEEAPLTKKSDTASRTYLKAIKKSILEASDISKNYTEIESDYIMVHDTSAMDFTYSFNYDSIEYMSRALIFYYDGNLYVLMLVQPNDLSDNSAFDKIIKSIQFNNADGEITSPDKESTAKDASENKSTSQKNEADSRKSNETAKPTTAKEIKESILAIHKDTVVLGSEDSLTMIIKMDESEQEADVRNYFEIISKICDTCNLESTYSSISFILYLDNSMTFTLSYKDYHSSTNFTSSGLVIFNPVYKEIATEVYNEYSSSND